MELEKVQGVSVNAIIEMLDVLAASRTALVLSFYDCTEYDMQRQSCFRTLSSTCL